MWSFKTKPLLSLLHVYKIRELELNIEKADYGVNNCESSVYSYFILICLSCKYQERRLGGCSTKKHISSAMHCYIYWNVDFKQM